MTAVALCPKCSHNASDEMVIDHTGDIDMTLAKIAGSNGLAATILDVFQKSLFFNTPQVRKFLSNLSRLQRPRQASAIVCGAIGQIARGGSVD